MRILFLVFFCFPLILYAQNKVGINTNNPQFDLDIRGIDDNLDGGELQLATPSETNFLRFFGGRIGDPNPFMAFYEMDTFHIVSTSEDWSTFARRMTISGVGDVGIGITNPQAMLDVAGGDWNLDAGNPGDLRIGNSPATAFRIGVANGGGGAGTTRMYSQGGYLLLGTNNSSHMAVSTGGNVGIGTTNPASKLDITAIGDSVEILRLSTERPWVFRQFGTGSNTRLSLQSMVNSKSFEILSDDGSNRAAVFYSNNDHSTVLLVPDGGEAGVGVEDPLAKFHIKHNSVIASPQLRLTESDNDFARIKMEASTDPGIYWDIAARADSSVTSSRLNFFYNNPGSTGDKVTIMGNGNVGIGTTNPSEKLHIIGDMRVSGLAGAGDRNVIVDSNGKFKIGVLGQGDTDWLETDDQVSTEKEVYIDSPDGPTSSVTVVGKASNGNNFSSMSLYNDAYFPGGTYRRLLMDANDIDAFRGTGVDPIHESLDIQRLSNGNLYLVRGGGKVGVGTSSPGSKLTVNGLDNNGSSATLELNSSGHKLLLDGNEIDGSSTVFINGNSHTPVGIGTLDVASGYMLSVDGKIIAEEVRVQMSGAWPDYVFSDQYYLMPLDQLKKEIVTKQHLPGIPTARSVESEGILLGEMQTKMMEKIEELTLHVIALHERISELEKENNTLRTKSRQ